MVIQKLIVLLLAMNVLIKISGLIELVVLEQKPELNFVHIKILAKQTVTLKLTVLDCIVLQADHKNKKYMLYRIKRQEFYQSKLRESQKDSVNINSMMQLQK